MRLARAGWTTFFAQGLLLLALLPLAGRAQAPAWQAAFAPTQLAGGSSQVWATAVNTAGDVFVTGNFSGQVGFGATVLTSAGSTDVFVAKWNTAAGAWSWATAGGGNFTDGGLGLAVSGTGVFVTGYFANDNTNTRAVQFGGTALNGTSTTISSDMFVAKYTDAGSSATFNWATAGGGTGNDVGNGLAVSGAGVFVTGSFQNDNTNTDAVQFGGTALNGASSSFSYDVFVAKYTDAGSSAAFNWATAGGGTEVDQGNGIAVSGAGVFVTGYFTNNNTNLNTVQFGGTALNGASTNSNTPDVFVAKYTDAGSSAAFNWATAGGGTDSDHGNGIAVSGTGVFVSGYITNNNTNGSAVQFGGTALNGASASAGNDVFVAKYTDAGSSATLNWATAGGGTGSDAGFGLAVSGAGVFVTGFITNDNTNTSAVQFGGTALNGASAASSLDVFVAKYTDAGSSAAFNWATAGGSTFTDVGYGIAVRGSQVVVGGYVVPPATFGSLTLSGVVAQVGFGAILTDLPSAPTLTGVSPAAELPGTVVTLTGTNFTAGSTVAFGGTAATGGTVVSATSLTVPVPGSLASGSAPITVSTAGGASAALPFTALAVYDGGTPDACTSAVPATASLNDGAWHYLLSAAGQVVAAYNYTGASLGNLALDVLRANPAAAVRQDNHSHYYLDRNFHLTASAGPFTGRIVALRLYGLNTELTRLQAADPAVTLANLKATQYSGPNEDCSLANDVASGEHRTLAAPASTPAGTGYFVAEMTVADHFSEFFLTGSSTPLPVELAAFRVTAEGPAAVRLAWATASEKNSAGFEVERSGNGTDFARLGTVAAAGSSSSARSYGFLDAKLPGAALLLYYRLKQVDLDGTFAYSPVRSVALTAKTEAGLALFPNPARSAATLTGALPGTVATVFDALGRRVTSAPADATGTAALALPAGLPTGVYVVRAGTQALRVVVE